jgi:hypothetical protein
MWILQSNHQQTNKEYLFQTCQHDERTLFAIGECNKRAWTPNQKTSQYMEMKKYIEEVIWC